MVCKMVVAAGASFLILSLLVPSDVEADGPCKIFRSRVPECHHSRERCRAWCRDEGYAGGFCDTQNGQADMCLCTQCSDDKLQVGQSPPPLPVPEPKDMNKQ